MNSSECPATHTVVVYENLSALPDRYELLFSHAGKISLFHSLPWYQNFTQTVLTPDDRMRIYAVDAERTPATARAVLLMRHSKARARLFSAETLSGLSNYYASLFGLVAKPGAHDMQGILDALAAAIAGDELRWDVIDLHPLAVDHFVFPGLIAAFRNAGLLVQTYFCFGNWYLQVRGRSYAEYFESLPSQLKSTVTRKRKQLDKSPNSRITIYKDPADVEEGVRAYKQIYAASWKIPEPYPNFIRGLCLTCAESGWLRLGVVYVDDQPAAAQIWIVSAGIAAIYKLAYDERFAKFSLGTILTANLMEHVIDVDKVHEIDYLTGDDAYKRDWMSDRRERWGIVAYNLRTPMGLVAGLRHVGGSIGRRVMNGIRRRGAAGN